MTTIEGNTTRRAATYLISTCVAVAGIGLSTPLATASTNPTNTPHAHTAHPHITDSIDTPHTPATSVARSSDLIPTWATPITTQGEREVLLQPILPNGNPGYDDTALLAAANDTFQLINDLSGGKLTVTATAVLPPIYHDAQATHFATCEESMMARVEATQRYFNIPAHKQPTTHLINILPNSGCRFGGLGHTPGWSIELFGVNNPHDIGPNGRRGTTLIHEFGHNLGLPHANRLTPTYTSQHITPHQPAPKTDPNEVIDYGNKYDIMGRSTLTGPIFDALTRAALGWGEDITILNPTHTHHHTPLTPLNEPGPDATLATDPTTGHRYLFTYMPNYGGTLIQQLNPATTKSSTWKYHSYGYVIPFTDSQHLWPAGWTYTTPTTGLRATTDTHGNLTITTHPDAPTTNQPDTSGPQWTRKPYIDRYNSFTDLVIPAALDTTGVSELHVTAKGRRIKLLKIRHDLNHTYPGRYELLNTSNKTRKARITVTITDPAGNTTTWKRTIKVRPSR